MRRSPLLWLGMFGLLFLLWAWGDCLRNTSLISYGTAVWRTSVTHADSEISVMCMDAGGDQAGWMYGRWERQSDLPFGRPSFQKWGGDPVLKLPDWLLVGLYLGVWGGLLAWRWRKRMRESC
ncbi:hypothetical protein [Haloferula sp. BvORR071]|uniref:hypothetical protein n=1 Tax=Haloferula sp. BvORR071 TaxID=1396141 RepID=UPI0005583F23|nr:hypothetical protein [Haloferula sp. BvORR071]